MTVDETAPLARLVRPGLPGVGVHIDGTSPHVCVLTPVKHCFTCHNGTANPGLSHLPQSHSGTSRYVQQSASSFPLPAIPFLLINALDLPVIDTYMLWNCLTRFSDNRGMVRASHRPFCTGERRSHAVQPPCDRPAELPTSDHIDVAHPSAGQTQTTQVSPTRRKPRSLDVLFSSATPEWNTPSHIIDHVLKVLGSIDLDPCSNSANDPNIPARRHYTKHDNGLTRVWTGRVYMNPPYGREIESWVRKLHSAYQAGTVREAITLLPARTDTQWFRILRPYPKCFVTGRLKFGEARNSAPFPSVVIYLGNRLRQFTAAFSSLGDIYTCAQDSGVGV
jgi:hypothetical protein